MGQALFLKTIIMQPYSRIYAALACISLFFLMGIMHREQSALFFGTDGVPQAVTLATPRGPLLLPQTDYSYFSFWFANAAYSRTFTEPLPPLAAATLPKKAAEPFSLIFPENRTMAILEATGTDGTKTFCGLTENPDGTAAIAGPCGNAPIASLRLVFAKPTSLKEKLELFRESF